MIRPRQSCLLLWIALLVMIPVAEFVPASYQCVFYELRGTGRSKVATMTAESMTLRHVVADLEALRVHLKQDRLALRS